MRLIDAHTLVEYIKAWDIGNGIGHTQEDARLYSHFGSDDHHIYDQIQKVLVKVITIVMNYEE